MGSIKLCFVLLALAFQYCYAGEKHICAGCPVEQDPKLYREKVLPVIQGELAKQNTGDVVGKILEVTTQVVAGIKTTVVFEVNNPTTNDAKICKIVYLQPPVEKQIEILDFSCNRRQTRSLLGGLKDVEPSEMEFVKQLGEMAAQTLDELDPKNNKREVVAVLDAKKQIVNGIMYYLKLAMKIKSCQASNDCQEDGPIVCNIKIYRSFADHSHLNAKVVSSECSSDQTLQLVGQKTEVSVDDKDVQEATKLAVDRINQMTNSIYLKTLVRVVDAKKQVVSGERIDLILEVANTNCMKNHHEENKQCKAFNDFKESLICKVSVLNQPWKNLMKVISADCTSARIFKRSLVGGETPVDVNDKRIQRLTGYISSELTARSNSQYTKTVVKVYNATIQIVSGTLTRVTVEVADTNCLKTSNTDPKDCTASQQGRQVCTLAIWEQPWIEKTEITQSECHSLPLV